MPKSDATRLAEGGTPLAPQGFSPSGLILQIHVGTRWRCFMDPIIKDKSTHVPSCKRLCPGGDGSLGFTLTFCPSPSLKAPFSLPQATLPTSRPCFLIALIAGAIQMVLINQLVHSVIFL